MKIHSSCLHVLVFCLLVGAGQCGAVEEILEGVDGIAPAGEPGHVYAAEPGWRVLVADDSGDGPYAMARSWFGGRIIATGHEGLLRAPHLVDNRRFIENAIRWLSRTADPIVALSQGRGEWVGSDEDVATLRSSFPRATGLSSFTDESLAGIDVLIIGNSWGGFDSAELDAIERFVNAGGGLWLFGLGWSYAPYNDYPMHELGRRFGFVFGRAVAQLQERVEGWPVFRSFYPETAPTPGALGALGHLLAETRAHPLDVATVATGDDGRADWLAAVESVGLLGDFLDASVIDPAQIREEITAILEHPQLRKTGGPQPPEIAYARVFLAAALRAAGVSPAGFVAATGLTGAYRDLYFDHGVHLADNARLDDEQLARIRSILDAVPPGLNALQWISVQDYLGFPDPLDPEGPYNGNVNPAQFKGVNIAGIDIDAVTENSFPDDVAPGIIGLFSAVLAHEVNHIVDAYYVLGHAHLEERRDALIRDAGRDPLNYLRSMFREGIFVDAPQEFVASISNQWFTDSEKTLLLGMARFDAGRRQPLEQAVFFADIYSADSDETLLVKFLGPVRGWRYETASLTRDARGRITAIDLGGAVLEVAWDEQDRIVGYDWIRWPPVEVFSDRFEEHRSRLRSLLLERCTACPVLESP